MTTAPPLQLADAAQIQMLAPQNGRARAAGAEAPMFARPSSLAANIRDRNAHASVSVIGTQYLVQASRAQPRRCHIRKGCSRANCAEARGQNKMLDGRRNSHRDSASSSAQRPAARNGHTDSAIEIFSDAPKISIACERFMDMALRRLTILAPRIRCRGFTASLERAILASEIILSLDSPRWVKPKRLNTASENCHECSAWPTEYRIGEVIMNPAAEIGLVLRGADECSSPLQEDARSRFRCALNDLRTLQSNGDWDMEFDYSG